MDILGYKLDKYSKVPLYHQLNEMILENIKNGNLKPGDYLPPEEEFCNKLELSRGTVRQAINNLVEKGYVKRERGKGTLIQSPTLNHDLIGDYSFGKGIEKLGLKLSSKILFIGIMNGKKSVIDRLKLEKKEKVIRVSRIRCANEEPWIYEESYLPAKQFPELEKMDLEKDLLIDILAKKYHTFLSRIDAFVEPTLVDEKHSQLLNIKIGSPALVMDRVLFDEEGRPAIYSHAFVRGDRCRYYFNVTR